MVSMMRNGWYAGHEKTPPAVRVLFPYISRGVSQLPLRCYFKKRLLAQGRYFTIFQENPAICNRIATACQQMSAALGMPFLEMFLWVVWEDTNKCNSIPVL